MKALPFKRPEIEEGKSDKPIQEWDRIYFAVTIFVSLETPSGPAKVSWDITVNFFDAENKMIGFIKIEEPTEKVLGIISRIEHDSMKGVSSAPMFQKNDNWQSIRTSHTHHRGDLRGRINRLALQRERTRAALEAAILECA